MRLLYTIINMRNSSLVSVYFYFTVLSHYLLIAKLIHFLYKFEQKSMSIIHQLQEILQPKQNCIRSIHSGFILHSTVFNNQSLLLTMGNKGEIHLYRKNNHDDWQHQSLFRAFDVPIIAYDVIPYLNQWKLMVTGYNNLIKLLRIIQQKYMILQQQLAIESEGPILNCLWNENGNQIYLSDAIGRMHVLSQIGGWKSYTFQIGSMPLRLAMGQNNKIYASINTDIQIITISSGEIKTINQEKIFKSKAEIVEIAVSKNSHGKYNSLVVLTKKSLQFFHLDDVKCFKICAFNLDSNATSIRIGWGRNYKELCIYQCIKGFIQTSLYQRRLDGLWFPSINVK